MFCRTEEVFLARQKLLARFLQRGGGKVSRATSSSAAKPPALELKLSPPDGTIISTHRIRDEALNDLRQHLRFAAG